MVDAVAVVGPTGSGKTTLAIKVAERLDTEIISADSMQIYRGMEIGTAAPTPEEQSRVRHHLVGIVDPSEDFSAWEFQARARRIVAALNRRGRPAVVAGGSGLFVSALIDGLFDGPEKDQSLRTRLKNEIAEQGLDSVYAKLERVDPAYAEVIQSTDARRVVRALEVYELTGKPLSQWHREHQASAESLSSVQVALDYPREQLYARIDSRVDRMIERGLVEEVRRLLDRGYEHHINRLKSLGYREIAAFLNGACSLEEAANAMKQASRRYARRQIGWFRADKRVRWLPVEEGFDLNAKTDEILTLLKD